MELISDFNWMLKHDGEEVIMTFLTEFFDFVFGFYHFSHRVLVGLGNGILTSSVYIVEVVSADNRGSVVMVSQ